MVTAIDFFCGAGGSSTGLVAAGMEVKFAANHWKLAIETHNTNHPLTEHDIADLQQTHPSRYPRTDIAWFSPSCTNHSLAKGKKRKSLNQLDLWGEHRIDPAEERSRATMREVVEFTEYHRYEMVIVENVVDVRKWQHYDRWMEAMTNMGYDCKVLYLNAQFFGVPQSRDRFYAVFWKKGNKAPDLDFRPWAFCTRCEKEVYSVQTWKKALPWGRFGKGRQYMYHCPLCGLEVQPGITPAYSVIDWTLPAEKIGDRHTALKPKTLERIRAGLKKFARSMVVDTSFTHDDSAGKVRPADEPMMTQTTRQSHALVDVPPFMAILKNSWSPDGTYTLPPRGMDEPLTTVVASASQHALIVPPLTVSTNHDTDRLRSTDDLLDTVMPHTRPSLVIPPFMLSYYNNASEGRPVDDPMYAIATGHTPPVVIPPFLMQYYSRDNAQSAIDEAIPVITTEKRHSLLIPPFFATYNKGAVYAETDQPMPTITGVERHGLTIPPFVFTHRQHTQPTGIDEPLSTVTAGAVQHVLIEPANLSAEDIELLLMQSKFRMLEPAELKRGMSFPNQYIILGNKRDQVKQIGNAVCVNVAEWIARRCMEALQ